MVKVNISTDEYEKVLREGANTAINVVINMIERELYKNKGADLYYDQALKTLLEKVKELNVETA